MVLARARGGDVEANAPELHSGGAWLRHDDPNARAARDTECFSGARERRGSPQAHGQGRRTARGRAEQTGFGDLRGDVPLAVPPGTTDCVLHQLSTPELLLRLHAL